jgi:hypothetical protein
MITRKNNIRQINKRERREENKDEEEQGKGGN